MPPSRPSPGLPQLALPLIASFTLRFAFGMVDLVYATRLEDPEPAVAAIGFYLPFQAGFVALWVGLSSGLTAALSRAFGHRDESRVTALRRATFRILAVVIPCASLAGVAIHFGLPHLGALDPDYALEPDLVDAFQIYGTTMLVGMPLTGFWSILPDSIVKAHHDTRSTMVAGLLATGTNFALNTLFVFGLGLGLFGIALATIVSRLTALAYATSRAARLERGRRGEWPASPASAPRWSPPVREIILLGSPSTLAFVLTATELALINGMLVTVPDSTEAIASWGVFHQLMQLSLMPTIAAGAAVLPFVARRVPEGQIDTVRRDLVRTGLLAAAAGLLVTVPAGVLFPDTVGGFFVRASQAGKLVVGDDVGFVATSRTKELLQLLPLIALAALPFLLLRPVFEALSRARVGILVTVLRFGVLSYPLLILGRFVAPRLGAPAVVGVAGGLGTAAAIASLATVLLARRELRRATETTGAPPATT